MLSYLSSLFNQCHLTPVQSSSICDLLEKFLREQLDKRVYLLPSDRTASLETFEVGTLDDVAFVFGLTYSRDRLILKGYYADKLIINVVYSTQKSRFKKISASSLMGTSSNILRFNTCISLIESISELPYKIIDSITL